MIDLAKEEFKAKLSGTIINFGFIEDRKEFFEWLVENGFLKFLRQRKNRAPDHSDFYVYQIFKDFNYEASCIQDHTDTCKHNIGEGGNMLVSLEYRLIGYKSQVQDAKL